MKTKIKFNKGGYYFIGITGEGQKVEDGRFIFVDSKKEIDDIVGFFFKYGWVPKGEESKDVVKEIDNLKGTHLQHQVIKRPHIKLFIWKAAAKFRKRPKEIGGDLKEYFK